MEAQSNIKKLVLYIIGAVLLILILVWLWHYFHTGKIIITTNNPNDTISLTKLDKQGKNTSSNTKFNAHGKLSINVSLGKYLASVEGNSIATTQVITLKSHKTLTYAINPVHATGVEPVTFIGAQNIAADNNNLLYLNTNSGNLNKIDSKNNIAVIGGSQKFKSVKWANTLFGIGQGSNKQLYVINNGVISPLSVPFAYDDEVVSYDVSPNKQIYVSHGADVYAGSQNGNFKNIYKADSSELLVAAGTNQVAVAKAAFDVDDSGESPLIVVNASGKVVKTDASTVIAGLSGAFGWSPSSRYLVAPNKTAAYVYDSALHQVSTLPTTTNSLINNVQWLDDSSMLYSTNDQLWMYNLNSQKANLLANMPLANVITGLTLSSDKSYVYLTTTDSDSSSAIRRVGLKDQKVPDYIFQLQSILPEVLTDYQINYVGFASTPTILVQPFPSSPPSPTYVEQAIAELQSDGFNPSRFKIELKASSDY